MRLLPRIKIQPQRVFMVSPPVIINPDLPEQFLPPNKWEWLMFSRVQGRDLRYGFCIPDNAHTVIVALPGLNDFAEKYFETAHWALKNGYGFIILDWFGQGGSGRYLDNTHKRHSSHFDDDVADCIAWIDNCVQAHSNRKPLTLLGHSMGGHMGLRALLNYAKNTHTPFTSATFIAPMFGIKALRYVPPQVLRFSNRTMREKYVPSGTDWTAGMHPPPALSILTKSKTRAPIHNAWQEKNEVLKTGAVTFGWLYDAAQSCKVLHDADLSRIKTPCLLFKAQHEMLVSNRRITTFSKRLPDTKLIDLEQSYHEPLMERDCIRETVLKYLNAHITECLKPA